jgi:hypothetical protein
MLSSISPLGERARATRWGTTVTAYLLGSTVGGLALGLLTALLGSVVPVSVRTSAPLTVLVAVALLLLGLLDALAVRGRLRLPSWQRQVDEQWLGEYRGWVYGAGFGLQLGFGLVTIITSTTVYGLVLIAAWSGDLRAGLLLGGTFGLVRALPVLTTRHADEPVSLRRLLARVDRWARPAQRAAAGALALAAVGVAAVMSTGGVL